MANGSTRKSSIPIFHRPPLRLVCWFGVRLRNGGMPPCSCGIGAGGGCHQGRHVGRDDPLVT